MTVFAWIVFALIVLIPMGIVVLNARRSAREQAAQRQAQTASKPPASLPAETLADPAVTRAPVSLSFEPLFTPPRPTLNLKELLKDPVAGSVPVTSLSPAALERIEQIAALMKKDLSSSSRSGSPSCSSRSEVRS